jgi:outer membrane protein assembly factor BamB
MDVTRPGEIGLLAVLVLVLMIGCTAAPDPASHGSESEPPVPATTWPGWGGPGRDFTAVGADLANRWPMDGPRMSWSRPLGEGYSAVVADGRSLYTMYRDGGDELVIAMNPDGGQTLWEYRYEAPAREGHVIQFGTGPNATPLLMGDRIITLGYEGALNCLDVENGERLWSHSLLDDLGGDVLEFGYAASPISHGGNVVVLVGGKRYGAVAFDPSDGSIAWSTPPSSVSYATPIIIEVNGQEQLVYFTADEIVGVEVGVGRPLWSFPVVNQYRNNATGPVWGSDGLLWVATQLDGGTRVLRLEHIDDETRVEEVWTSDRMSIHFWNTLRIDDTIYASVGGNGSVLIGVDVTSGEVLWRERGFEKENFVGAGDRALLLDANGHLALARLSPTGIQIDSEARISEGPTWTAPTLMGSTLYVRDKETVSSFDLGPAISSR